MWPRNFSERLHSWAQLREQSATADVESALTLINQWWFQAPWSAYHLHWDDQSDWPDPWQLLDDNIYCSLARGLGIMYTIALVDRPDLQDACLIEHAGDNLVLVDQKKYMLNWDPDQIVNISLEQARSQKQVDQQKIKQKIS
jgi:hypothetical protein